MKRFLTSFMFLGFFCTLSAQKPERVLLCADTLFINQSEDGELYLQWRVGRGTGLFTITEATGYSIPQLHALNPILHFRDIEACDIILTPFDHRMLDITSQSGEYPVYYKVKQGETLFGIAKRSMQIPVDTLMHLNGLIDSSVKPGHILQVGWLNTSASRNEPVQTGPSPWLQQSDLTNGQATNSTTPKSRARQKGVAWWNKTKPDPNLFVLHRLAPVNSFVEIRNPMFGRSVLAKVIGTIPPTYPEDIVIIVSQGVAKTLGAIDGRFYVELSYDVK